MKTKPQSDIAHLLQKCARLLEELSDADLAGLLDGSLKLAVVGNGKELRKGAPSGDPSRFRGDVELEEVAEHLRKSTSRNEAFKLLRESDVISDKSALARLARLLRVHITKHDKREDLEDKIVEAVIGVRLRSEAIHGLNLKGTSSSAHDHKSEGDHERLGRDMNSMSQDQEEGATGKSKSTPPDRNER